jgi:hypothetical protein
VLLFTIEIVKSLEKVLKLTAALIILLPIALNVKRSSILRENKGIVST